MKKRVIIRIFSALPFIILSQILISFVHAQSYEVAYTYGFIEVKRDGQETWERVRRTQKLSDDDLVRIPPESVFRIREPNGEFANIPAGQ